MLTSQSGIPTERLLACTSLGCVQKYSHLFAARSCCGAARASADLWLAGHTLLHVNDRNDWKRWLNAAGADAIDLSRGPVLNQASMALDAAVDGQGVALARSALAAWDLIGGRLVRPFDLSLPVSYAYWIVCPKATAKLPKIVIFRDWLLAEAAKDARQLREISR